MDKFRSMLSLLLVSSALAVAFHNSFFLSTYRNEISVLAFSMDKTFPSSYDDRDDSSRGISVQQDVTQLNICSSNTAYCHNDVDNDFNVNPP